MICARTRREAARLANALAACELAGVRPTTEELHREFRFSAGAMWLQAEAWLTVTWLDVNDFHRDLEAEAMIRDGWLPEEP